MPRIAARITGRVEDRKRMTRNARRWTAAKLEKELTFAQAFEPYDDATQDWRAVVEAEAFRRQYMQRGEER